MTNIPHDAIMSDDGTWKFELQRQFHGLFVDGTHIATEIHEQQKIDFAKAVELYETAIETGFRAAMDPQAAREKAGCDNEAESGIPVGLLWLVQARRNEALSKMETGDLEGAVLAAQASCNIARNRCPDSLEVLAEIYQKGGDAKGELQALTNLFDLPVDKDLPMQVANKRRELGFRKAKLEREASA